MLIPSSRYGFIRGRQLEGTYPGDPKRGIWGISSNRISYGWGQVDVSEWPYVRPDGSDFLAPEPAGIDQKAKRHRIGHYERIRCAADARAFLEHNSKLSSRMTQGQTEPKRGQQYLVQLAFRVTREFMEAPHGQIAMPSRDSAVLGTHCVALSDYSYAQKWFEFYNTWGPSWGNNGQGYMPADFIDGWMTESWGKDWSKASLPECRGINVLRWDIASPVNDRVYGLEIYDGDADERIGWSFVVLRNDHLEIEELFVRPSFRRRGFGGQLVASVLELSKTLSAPLRAWVPFVDCTETNLAALARTIIKLGMNIRPSGVTWAAYLAMPNKDTSIVFNGIHIPEPPAYANPSAPRANDNDHKARVLKAATRLSNLHREVFEELAK